MGIPEETRGALYRQYRREIEGAPLTRALKRAVIVLFVINTAFIFVDWVVYPEQVWSFVPVRLGLDLVLGVIYLWSSDRFPVASSFATSFAGGGMLFAVVMGTGGASSDYYVGLVLLVIGIGVLAPLSTAQGASAIGSLFACYTMIPLISTNSTIAQSSPLNVFFLAAAAFVGVMSCAYLDRMRFGDFLQRRQLEDASRELQELDKEKSRFTANVHHELRTPLTLMLAPIDAFLSGTLGDISDGQRRYLETMRSNGKRLLKLINNLLDFAKSENQQLVVKRVRCNVGSLIEGVVEGARPLASQKGIAIEIASISDTPEICVDPDAIEKVVINVLGNALKFTGRGGTISIEGCEQEGGGILLTFIDDGVGLEVGQLDRIFDRFAQADSSTTRRHEGTGIGLSLARELVRLHSGEIWAESDGLGHGTEIHLLLPAGDPDSSEEVEVLRAHDGVALGLQDSIDAFRSEVHADSANRGSSSDCFVGSAEGSGSGRAGLSEAGSAVMQELDGYEFEVLVVEDNRDMRGLLRDILSTEYRVREACNGREGLEEIRAALPDLILTDVMMPEMSGIELCQAVKGDDVMKSIPLVLVTSKAEADMKVEGLELGADDYVTKPFHPKELLARVRSLVRLHNLKGELSEKNEQLENANAGLQTAISELTEATARLVFAERLAAVGELAAGIAHEVNNPVNFSMNALRTLKSYVSDIETVAMMVQGIVEIEEGRSDNRIAEVAETMERMEFGDIPKALSELVEIATEGLDRTHRLVADLRDFAAPDQVEDTDVDIVRSIESTMHLVRHSLDERGVEIEFHASESELAVRGQAHALNQVFLNLIKNSADAIGSEGGRVVIGAERNLDSILITVTDDGPGISPEILEHLFEPFFSTKAAGDGTGMGLSICRRIIAAHNGDIEVSSSVGSGAEFRVRLPGLKSSVEGEAVAASV